MKKINIYILLIFLLIITFNIKINAIEEIPTTPIIAEVGASSFKDFDEEGAITYSGNIQYDNEGEYDLRYVDNENNIIKRNILVVNSDNLNNGVAYTQKKLTVDKTKENTYDANVYYTSNNFRFAYINEESGGKNYVTMYIYGEGTEYEYKEELENIFIVSAIIRNEQIYALYEYKDNDNTKIGVMIINKYLQIIRDSKYISNKNENAIAIIDLNNTLYLILNSTSNTGFIERSTSYKVGVIMEINAVSLRKENINIIANNNDSYINGVIIRNDKINLICNFSGTSGTFYNTFNKNYNGRMIVELDSSGAYVLSSISDTYSTDNIILANNGYFLVNKYSSFKSNVDCKYVDYFDDNKNYTITILLDNDTTDIYSFTYDNKLFIIQNGENIINKINLINEKNIELAYFSVCDSISKVCFYNDNIYLMNIDGNCNVYEFSLFQVNKIFKNAKLKENYNIKYQKINVYRNFKLEDYNENYDLKDENYGTYNVNMKVSLSSCKIIYKSLIEVPLMINIINDGTYDIGMILSFNGKGYLNNTLIDSGYIINDIGKYQLDIVGANNQKNTYSFEVLDLCEKQKVNETKGDETNINYIKYEESKLYLNNPNYEVSLYKKKESFEYAFIFLLIFLAGFLIFFIFKCKEKRERK